jgi:hypothetical protein
MPVENDDVGLWVDGRVGVDGGGDMIPSGPGDSIERSMWIRSRTPDFPRYRRENEGRIGAFGQTRGL